LSKKDRPPDQDKNPSPQDQSDQFPLNQVNISNLESEHLQQVRRELQSRQAELEMQRAELASMCEELQSARDKYIILYDYAPSGYVTLDQHGIILEANLRLANLLESEKNSLIGVALSHYIGQDSLENFWAHLADTLKTGVRHVCEIWMRKKNGKLFFARMESIAVRDRRGHLSQCNSIITDISDRRENNELSHYQDTLTEISPDAILATDKDLNITNWNKAAEKLFGWSAEEVSDKNVSIQIRTQVLAELSKDEVMSGLCQNGHWIGEYTNLTKNGIPVNTLVSIGILWDSNAHFNGILAIHHPHHIVKEEFPVSAVNAREGQLKERIEELNKTNRILRQEINIHKKASLLAKEWEGKNSDLMDNIKLGIFRCTPGVNGQFLEVNKAMEEITGYSREELLQMTVCNLYVSDNESNPFKNEVNIADWKVMRELRLRRKDGHELMIAETLVAIRFDSGSVQYFDGILEDITERKQAQQQIQNSLQRLQKTIKEIIEAIAHIGEVRDPYTAGHQRRVAQISYELAHMMGLTDEQNEGLTMAAFVHDIGKILVPADILSKPGKLTKPEFDMLKDHTRIGYEILKTIEFPWPIAKIVLQHHERMNGSGYPSGLVGEDIIIEARILAVADVVEAMSSHRPYRPALGIDKALDEISRNRGILYDPKVVAACLELFKDRGFNLN